MGEFRMGMSIRPEWEHARPAAVVNVERPFFITIGFLLLILGFFIQYLAVPDLMTIERLRAELKAIRKLTKHK